MAGEAEGWQVSWWRRIVDAVRDWFAERFYDEPEPERKWRTDMDTIRAKDGRVTFYTRNLSIPTGDGRNRNGGFEWIIARVRGDGYERLLLMVMGGNRAPCRIWFNHKPFADNRWEMPLMREAKWDVYAKDGELIVELDGNVIWTARGGYTVNEAIMGGYNNRNSTGEWSR